MSGEYDGRPLRQPEIKGWLMGGDIARQLERIRGFPYVYSVTPSMGRIYVTGMPWMTKEDVGELIEELGDDYVVLPKRSSRTRLAFRHNRVEPNKEFWDWVDQSEKPGHIRTAKQDSERVCDEVRRRTPPLKGM